jgi:hypothetical protein
VTICGIHIVVRLAVQQVAYQVRNAKLPGFWWPLAQFGALYLPGAYGIGKTAP